jgi:hypothetical protein
MYTYDVNVTWWAYGNATRQGRLVTTQVKKTKWFRDINAGCAVEASEIALAQAPSGAEVSMFWRTDEVTA